MRILIGVASLSCAVISDGLRAVSDVGLCA